MPTTLSLATRPLSILGTVTSDIRGHGAENSGLKVGRTC